MFKGFPAKILLINRHTPKGPLRGWKQPEAVNVHTGDVIEVKQLGLIIAKL